MIVLNDQWTLEIECNHIHGYAQLLVAEDDVRFSDAYTSGLSREMYYVECPRCYYRVEIPQTKIPLQVRDKARTKFSRRQSKIIKSAVILDG